MSATVVKKDFEAYLREARSWETDKLQQLEHSRTIAWRVAVGSAVLAVAAVLGLAALRRSPGVDYEAVRPLKRRALVAGLKVFHERELSAGTARSRRARSFVDFLEAHAE